MSSQACPICDAPLPERLDDPAEPEPCDHAEGEWWNRADWRCPCCDLRLIVNQMYEYGGMCPCCSEPMKLDYIQPFVPF